MPLRSLWILVCLIGCDVVQPASEPQRLPLSFSPADGSEGVDRNSVIQIISPVPLLDDGFAQFQLVSGPTEVVLLRIYDPSDRSLTLVPQQALGEALQYRIDPTFVQAMNGDIFRTQGFFFQTSREASQPSKREATDIAARAVSTLAAHCSSSACHGGATPALGLDLSSYLQIKRTALSQAATQTGGILRDSDAGFFGMARIDSFRPGRSYLLHKIAETPGIQGNPMPPGSSLTPAEKQTLARWIAQGAPGP